jgi:hypothetical protein
MREKIEQIDPTFDPSGTQSMPQYERDKRKGWGAYIKSNVLRKHLKINI